jgi:hypothetical protein
VHQTKKLFILVCPVFFQRKRRSAVKNSEDLKRSEKFRQRFPPGENFRHTGNKSSAEINRLRWRKRTAPFVVASPHCKHSLISSNVILSAIESKGGHEDADTFKQATLVLKPWLENSAFNPQLTA